MENETWNTMPRWKKWAVSVVAVLGILYGFWAMDRDLAAMGYEMAWFGPPVPKD